MRALLLGLALLPGAAAAQDACVGVWERLVAATEGALAGEPRPGADGWCQAWDLRLGGADAVVAYGADSLRWRGEGLDRVAAGTGWPTALEVEVEGLRPVQRTGSATLDWLLAVQNAPWGIDGRLAAEWDAPARTLRVAELSADFPGRSALRAGATLAGVDLSTPGAAQTSLGSAALTALEAEVVADGLFESYLLLPLGELVLGDASDPRAAFKAAQGRAIEEAARLPASIFAGDTPAELAELVRDLPHPLGTLRLSLAAPGGAGLGAPRFARFALSGVPQAPEELWPALEGLAIAADWTPLPPEE